MALVKVKPTSNGRRAVVKLVNAIMTKAVGDRASDVHIEPAERNVRIRFRVDGVLHEPMPPAPTKPRTAAARGCVATATAAGSRARARRRRRVG